MQSNTTFEIPLFIGEHHFVDWSSLLDPPAGKYGRVENNQEHFQFKNGKTIRFWGINMVAGDCFPSKEDAKKIAKRLAKMGCNLVRLHHMDAPWATPNIFGNTSSSLCLAATSLAKLDYFIFELKEQGIYVFIDLLVHRKFGRLEGFEEGEVPLGGQQAAFIDNDLQLLQKQYIEALFTHQNPYTKLSYNEDPVVLGCLLINEATVLGTTTGNTFSPKQFEKLQELYKQKTGTKIKKYEFEVDYTVPGGQIIPNKKTPQAFIDFLLALESSYYTEMSDFLKNEIGYDGLIAGSNFPFPQVYSLQTQASLDLIAVNAYWDHPMLHEVNHDWDRVEEASIHNRSQIKLEDYFYNHLIQLISRFSVVDKPLLVTEWNTSVSNQFALEAPIVMSAYGSLQGWGGMCQFSFEQPLHQSTTYKAFDIAQRADIMAQWCIAAPMYLKGYIKPAEKEVTFHFSPYDITSLVHNKRIDQYPLLPYWSRIRYDVDEVQKNSHDENIDGLQLTPSSSLQLDFEKGRFEIRNDFVQGIIGYWQDQTIDFPLVQLHTKNKYASVMMISKDNVPLKNSQHFLIVIVMPVEVIKNENSLKVETFEGSILFKHEMQSHKVLISPLYMEKGTKSYYHLEEQDKGMCWRVEKDMPTDTGQKHLPSFVYEVEVVYEK